MKSFTLSFCALFFSFQTFLFALAPGSFYSDGNKNRKAIALTFDDGPGETTLQVLDILDRYQVKATFFMNGDQVELRPQIAKEVVKRGHEIGDHTYSHVNFYAYEKKFGLEKTKEKIQDEMKKSNGIIQNATGAAPRICRMPHGYHRAWLGSVAMEFNYVLVNWTFGTDWLNVPQDQMAKSYIKHLRSGSILLFHDGGKNRSKTVQLLPLIIEEAQKRGFVISKVSEILE